MDKNTIKSNISLLTAAMIWGLAFVAQSDGMNYVGPFTFCAVRCFLAVLFLLPLWLIISSRNKASRDKEKTKAVNKKTFVAGLACGTALFFATASQQIGLQYTTAGKAGFITALYIVLVPVFSAVAFKKKAGIGVWISVAFAVVGLYLLCSPGGENSVSKGDLYLLACAFVFAVQILLVDKYAEEVDGILLSLVQFLVVMVLSAICMFIFNEEPSFEAISGAWLSLCYTGFLSSGVAYTLQIVGQKYGKNPTVASLLMSMESVFAAIFGWLILKERLSSGELGGAMLMCCAIVLAQIPVPKKFGFSKQ